jgi:hypothetical protein
MRTKTAATRIVACEQDVRSDHRPLHRLITGTGRPMFLEISVPTKDLTVTMAHPDALASLLSGYSGSITAHFGQSPSQDEELKNSKVRTVLTSHEVLGGTATSELLATTVAFHDANPVLSGLSLMPSRKRSPWQRGSR